MGKEIISKKLTLEDVERINKENPEYIEVVSTKYLDKEVLSKLNEKIMIKIIGEDSQGMEKAQLSISDVYYKPGQLIEIMTGLERLESGIQKDWSDLDKALYVYVRLIDSYDVPSEYKSEVVKSLESIFSREQNSTSLSLIYKEIMDRIGIPCKYVENKGRNYSWNEIGIDDKFYPVDIAKDVRISHKEGPNAVIVHNFGKNPKFYQEPEHETDLLDAELLEELRLIDPGLVQESLSKVVNKIVEEKNEIKKEVEKDTETEKVKEKIPVQIHSKELEGVFKSNVIDGEVSEVEQIKITLKDDNFEELKKDISNMSTYYPELLSKIEIENTSGSSRNIQEVIDHVYKVTTDSQLIKDDTRLVEATTHPVSITITSSFGDDFDIDLSKVPAVVPNTNKLTDSDRPMQRIVFKNSDTSRSVSVNNISGKISENIEGLSFEGIDLDGLDLTGTNITELRFVSDKTVNIDRLLMPIGVKSIEVDAVTPQELNTAINNTRIHRLIMKNQNLHDRRIFEELSVNPNLVSIYADACHINELAGLDRFDGRLVSLGLWENDLTVNDLDYLTERIKNNTNLEYYFNANHNIRDAIRRAPDISDDSFDFIENYTHISGTSNTVIDKERAIDVLLWSMPDIPYYIKDAKIIRDNLHIKINPMMVKDDYELEHFNFDEAYLRDGTLLLTVPQIERLLSLGKVVPQDVRIMLGNTSELSGNDARDLVTRMTNAGMNLSGVQLFDKNNQNGFCEIHPYSMSEYVYIRDTLDTIVSGIDPTESDLDKFATIYKRLSDSIVYDHGAVKKGDTHESLYYAQKLFTSRNLLEGLEEGQCVCAGYADILKNALDLVGIEARYIGGSCDRTDDDSGHAWNQVLLDDGHGNKKWYYTDLTWDAGKDTNEWTLRGANNHVFQDNHQVIDTNNLESVNPDDYDRTLVRDAMNRAKAKSFNFRDAILIPQDPNVPVEVLDPTRIVDEYKRRKDDMCAKYYGDADYRREYMERSRRFRSHEIEANDFGIDFRTIEDYPERQEDEQFLLLDKYAESLERMTRHENGDTSVYSGTPDQIRDAYEKDREYVTTRNHTFNQHTNTRSDLATLGKYGEVVPYIPRQQGVARNIVRAVGNVGIFARNLVSPVYRVVGRYVVQPMHRLIIGDRDASPFRNNFYHRMVARRDYFEEKNRDENPNHPFRNAIKSRFQAIFNAKEGNKAVLNAGAYDIRENLMEEERERIVLDNLVTRSSLLEAQIQNLQDQISLKPYCSNIAEAQKALADKISTKASLDAMISERTAGRIGMTQTDAISDKQHAIASKEVNTMKVTVIKGVLKGVAAKYVGPKIHNWLAERGKTTEVIDIKTQVEETRQRWIDPTYKTESQDIYGEVFDGSKSMEDLMSTNSGRSVEGFYSVYSGENRPAMYNITGNENVTAVFMRRGNGGTGLSDTVGLTAPVLTDRTFDAADLTSSGLLNQSMTIDELIDAVSSGTADSSALNDIYISVGDRYWARLSDFTEGLTKEVVIGTELREVIDVPGHFENYTELVDKIVSTTRVVDDPRFIKLDKALGIAGKTFLAADGIVDVSENLRRTTSDVVSNKVEPREFEFDIDTDDIPTSKREYELNKDDGR